ncbi:site-2 protease family protein [Enterococcus sp. LJL99]
MFKYSDEQYDLLKDENDVFVKDKKNNRYFQISANETEEMHIIEWKEYTSKVSKNQMIIFLILFIFLYLCNFSIVFFKTPDVSYTFFQFTIFALLYLIIFIVVHEAGHIFFYKKFGGKINKIGFKLNYIFPSLYVRMNDTYLFSKYEKLVVHGGGLLFSLVLNGFLFFIGSAFGMDILITLTKVMFLDIIWNTTPVLNSDGYKIMLTLFSVNEKKYLKNNSKLVLFFKIVNLIVISIYLARMIIDLWL